ncbi:MAG: hypothetical protein FJ265_14485 [Planctomycetes bacterium]|nr:hypothetical protein [Planctomycetota bacterium]
MRLFVHSAPWILGLAAAFAPAQAPPDPHADPYVGRDPAALARAGYASLGPFPFGTAHGSRDVEALLPAEALVWIETAHFRIGCALGAVPLGTGSIWRRRAHAEIDELRARLPKVEPKPKQLDRWLRAHLVAQRAERLYAEVQAVLRCSDADFAAGGDEDTDGGGRSPGPFLGQRQKFTVLLFERAESLAAYTATFHGVATTCETRFLDMAFGTAFYGAAAASDGGLLHDDESLAVHLAYHLAHNLYSSYLGFRPALPAWVTDGLGHWHARQVSGRVPVFCTSAGAGVPCAYEEWPTQWASLLRTGRFEPLPVFCARPAGESDAPLFHLQSWALAQYLVAERPLELASFLRRLAAPDRVGDLHSSGQELHARQAAALREAFGTDAAGLESAWARCRPSRRPRN